MEIGYSSELSKIQRGIIKTHIIMESLYVFIKGERPQPKNISKCDAEFPNLKGQSSFQNFEYMNCWKE